MLSSIEILILSLIQGISEFLPISSLAHLVLISKYYAFTNQNLLIDICLHLGSLLAIIVYFRSDLFSFIKNKNFLRFLDQRYFLNNVYLRWIDNEKWLAVFYRISIFD